MFTGLIEEIGTVEALINTGAGVDLKVRGPLAHSDAALGDSIAVQGVCLTVTERDGDLATFGLAPETLRRTSLGILKAGDGVNMVICSHE